MAWYNLLILGFALLFVLFLAGAPIFLAFLRIKLLVNSSSRLDGRIRSWGDDELSGWDPWGAAWPFDTGRASASLQPAERRESHRGAPPAHESGRWRKLARSEDRREKVRRFSAT